MNIFNSSKIKNFLFCTLMFLCTISSVNKSIEVVTHSPGTNMVNKFDNKLKYSQLNIWDKTRYDLKGYGYLLDNFNEKNIVKKKNQLWNKQEKIPVDTVLFCNTMLFDKYKRFNINRYAKTVLIMYEPPTVMPQMYKKRIYDFFDIILTWDDDLVDNKKFFKFYYAVLMDMIKITPTFEQKKFCCMVVANKRSNHKYEIYSERIKAIEFFEKNKNIEFDLYGHGWENCGYSNYKGSIKDKINTVKDYKFCICYENTKNIKGYVTEKIFNAFQSGCIPVYFGAPNILDYIPKNCFIDFRDFKNYNELYSFLKNMKEDEYNILINNIRSFLKSGKAQLYSQENLKKILIKTLTH
jgi:alpha(1,3/1,4) fucosyltransferase